MAKSLNKEQLINVIVALVASELESREDQDSFREFLEGYTVEELVDYASDVDNVDSLVDEFEDWCDQGEDQDEDQEDSDDLTEESMQEILDNLHVGFNEVPGLGVGYAASEEDLKDMKMFVIGALVAKKAIQNDL